MRNLTSKQKKILIECIEKDPTLTYLSKGVNDLPDGIWERLAELNDTEILYQEVERFMHDYEK